MNKLTSKEWELLEEFELGEITKSELESRVSFRANFQEFSTYLDEIRKEKNAGKFETLFWNLPYTMTEEERCLLLKEYLVESWHYQHEEMISAFQRHCINNPKNIETIVEVINNPPEYLSKGMLYESFLKKCIYAIAAQPDPFNKNTLDNLSNSEDEIIKKLAIGQLNRINN